MLAFFWLVIVLLFVALPLVRGPGRDGIRLMLRKSSRLLVSGKRQAPPPVLRAGGLAGLPRPLAVLVGRRRQLEAAVHALLERAPAYHQTFEVPATDLLDDRRQQAVRRGFEDAVIHVARALDGYCHALRRLDDPSRARLHAAGPLPDVPGLLRRFSWLPRHVHGVGYLHFRDDLPRLQQALLELDEELSRVEQALTHERGLAYR